MSEVKSDMRRKVFLIGIGMGGDSSITVRAEEIIRKSDCLIGAERMIACAAASGGADVEDEIPRFQEYRADAIRKFIGEHPQYRHIAVLLSGDTGFYSGAKKLAELLEEEPDLDTELVPGLSSIVYLAAKIGISWEDAEIVSLHGQEENFIQTVSRNRKTFFLLGGRNTGRRFLERFREFGMRDVEICIGKNLSYPDEEIIRGSADELKDTDAEGLCAAYVFHPQPENWASPHVPDKAFIRGEVPMTKEEIRAASIAQLQLSEDAVVYDVGAGTGSVSVEAARCSDRIRVYAIEKKTAAVQLIRENRKKFKADGIRVVEGTAPEALEELESPTHVFIGGSSGNLKEILECVLAKNPQVRIVINAISLETVGEVMDAAEAGLLKDPQITQISAARSRKLGRYHMMTGMNPVYIISSGGDLTEEKEI